MKNKKILTFTALIVCTMTLTLSACSKANKIENVTATDPLVTATNTTVNLYSTEAGGRTTAITNPYRPYIQIDNKQYTCSMSFGEAEDGLEPGESTNDCTIQIMGATDIIKNGDKFVIVEAQKIIGEGEIGEITSIE